MNFYVLYLNLSDYIYFLRQTVKKFFARRQAHRIVEDGDSRQDGENLCSPPSKN